MSLDMLPAELKMNIASRLELRELILLRNASKRWQTVINNNLSFIRPVRGDLLRLWDDTVRSPYFLPSRQRITASLFHFDRRKYLAGISQGLPLPEDFELWVLEWPAKAVIGWTWPGLGHGVVRDFHDEEFPPPEDFWWQLYGRNLLRASRRGPPAPLYVWDKIARDADETSMWKQAWDAHLDRKNGKEKLHKNVADRDVGVAIPVWSTDPYLDYKEVRILEYVLVISGLGATYNGSVQPFTMRFNRNVVTLYDITHLDRDAIERGVWQDGPWTEGNISATSWIGWLRRQLEIVENKYKQFAGRLGEGARVSPT